MSQRYTITTADYCTQGFERLRNQNEFLLVAYPSYGDNWEVMRDELSGDIQACSRPDGFDYDAARFAVASYCLENRAWLDAICRECEPDETREESDESNPCTLFLYVRDNDSNLSTHARIFRRIFRHMESK